MDEIKSIFQVPVTKDFVDLHYLIHISSAELGFIWAGNSGNSTIKILLHYRLSPSEIIISIRPIDLLSQDEMKSLGNKWQERSIKNFDERIRMPLVRAWENYRKHMTE